MREVPSDQVSDEVSYWSLVCTQKKYTLNLHISLLWVSTVHQRPGHCWWRRRASILDVFREADSAFFDQTTLSTDLPLVKLSIPHLSEVSRGRFAKISIEIRALDQASVIWQKRLHFGRRPKSQDCPIFRRLAARATVTALKFYYWRSTGTLEFNK